MDTAFAAAAAAGTATNGHATPDDDPLPFPDLLHPVPEEARRLSREQVRQMRRLEAEGVPFFLHRTGIEATVRALSFADKTLLAGLPSYLQQEVAAAFNQAPGGNAKKTFSDYVRAAANDEKIANVACVAGFIRPRLTLTEEEADRAHDPDVWWVGDLHIEERKRYMGLVIGGAAEEDLKRIAGFLDARLAAAGTD